MTDDASGKSKRDLIWEQKRKAREDRLRGGSGGGESQGNPMPDPFGD